MFKRLMNNLYFRLKAVCISIILLLCSSLVLAANPSLEWKTHESEHFLVHYPHELTPLVSKVVTYSENSHETLSTFFQWTPKDKTHVVLLDDFDQSNGYAQPMPNNTITLFTQPPTDGELLVYDDWLKMLIHHEYTHILHIDKVLGFPSFLRHVFGRIFFTFPNALHPNWFTEGLATYQESITDGRTGRGNSDLFEIMMRAEVEAGIKDLSRINTVNAHDFPLNTAYLYGVYFFKFIRDVYGEHAIKQLIDNYSDNIIPYMVDSNSILVTGKSLSQLWPDFSRYLQGYFDPQTNRINGTKETNYKVLSDAHEAYGLIAKGIENDVWYSAEDKQLGSHLYRYHSAKEQSIIELNSLATIDVNSNGELVISQIEYCGDYSQFYDLYLYTYKKDKKAKNKLKKITSCSRYRLAKWIDENRILALRYVAGKPFLDILDRDGQVLESVWEGDEKTVLSAFDVSVIEPGMLKIIASIKFGLNSWGAYTLNAGEWLSLGKNHINPSYPNIQGDEIVFIQSNNGQSEIHRVNSSNETVRITHSKAGIKQAVETTNGDLIGLRYSAMGYQVVSLEGKAYPAFYINSQQGSSAVLQDSDFDPINLTHDNNYYPYKSLIPSYWFPIYFNDEYIKKIGVLTSGADALGSHLYNFQINQETNTDNTLVLTDYIYDNRFLLGLNQDIDFFQEFGISKVYKYSETWFAGYVAPYISSAQQFYPYMAVSKSTNFLIDGLSNSRVSNIVTDNWLALGLNYSNTKSTRWSADASKGWQARVTLENADILDNDRLYGNVLSIDLKHYLPMLNRHTLAQRFFVGYSLDSNAVFQLGGAESDAFVGPGIQIKQRTFPLRGFSKGLANLTDRNVVLHSLEYRLPVNWMDKTFMAPPIGLNGWSLRGFVDSGSAWEDSSSTQSFYTGVGVEVIFDTTVAYYLGLRVRIGAAEGLGSEGEKSIYMELGGSF
ncbi:MAG: hypothetical protein ACI843_000679 [Psychrobacter glaciei]|jgi:hypothetical protein